MPAWLQGEYVDANQKQDDVTIIAGYLPAIGDDVGNTAATAVAITSGTLLAA